LSIKIRNETKLSKIILEIVLKKTKKRHVFKEVEFLLISLRTGLKKIVRRNPVKFSKR